MRYEQARSLGIPYRVGGLEDQPYLWMQEHGVIYAFLQEQEALDHAEEIQRIVEGAKNAGTPRPNPYA